ncbi:MAG: caspase domain-containing protein, partial [Bacteroidota bacterium]
MVSSAKLSDGSILILYNSGNGIRVHTMNKIEVTKISFPSEYSFSSSFCINQQHILFTTWNGELLEYDDSTNTLKSVFLNKYPLFSGTFNKETDLIALSDLQGRIQFLSLKDYHKVFTIYNLNDKEKLIVDSSGRFDGSPGAIDYLYLTCGLEVIDLAQVKDSLWVPGLAEKIMKKEPILINDKPAPKLSDLNICELTPLIEPLEKGDKGIFRYQITPRNGGLGETEVYINGNLTYTLKPHELERKVINQKEIYFLTISKDSLAPFLAGDKYSLNPLMVKSKVKGASIYGRGVQVDVEKDTDAASPSFYGVFIGVNDYANENKEINEYRYKNLDFAKKDADDLANAVEATARNLFMDSCHIYKLTGLGTDPNAPTKARIQEVLEEIGKNAKSSDVLFIFFAGHGDILQANNQKEIRFILHRADKKNLMSTSFGVEELKQWCDPKLLKAQKRIFVFDACHSGEIINQTMAFNGRGDEEGLRIRQLDKLKDKNGMMILAAAADNEFAYEDETLNQGVLT